MGDLVDRLRRFPVLTEVGLNATPNICTEAADRIAELEAENEQLRARGLDDDMEAIPSRERCGWCHEYSAVGFHVPNAIWAAVVPERFRQTIACLRCFARMADERLVRWDDGIRFFPVSLRTHLEATSALSQEPGHGE